MYRAHGAMSRGSNCLRSAPRRPMFGACQFTTPLPILLRNTHTVAPLAPTGRFSLRTRDRFSNSGVNTGVNIAEDHR